MAERNLIKGIDNSCEAVRVAARRAEQNGMVWPTPKPVKGIDNSREVARAVTRPRGAEVI